MTAAADPSLSMPRPTRPLGRWIGYPVLLTLFSAMLLPEWFPDLSRSPLIVWYMLALALTVLVLFAMAIGLPAGLVISKNHVNTQRVKRWWQFSIIGLVLFALIGSSLIHLRNGLPLGSHILDFDESRWKGPAAVTAGTEVTDRQKMLGDLVARVLPNRSRAEVIAILGEPEARGELRALHYPLGFERGSLFAIDSEVLIVHFDSAGRFSHVDVHVD